MALHVIAKPKDEFESRLITVDRVTRVTSGGRRLSFRAIMIVGNRQGQVGVGVAKANDIARAIDKATRMAKKRIVTLPIEEGTVPFSVEMKYKSARVILRPSKAGGIIAGGVARHICELGGIKHINAKVLSRTKNPLNNARAAMAAFNEIRNIKKVHSV